MNKEKTKVVFVGFDVTEKKDLWSNIGKTRYVDTLKEALEDQGFMIVIKQIPAQAIQAFDQMYRFQLKHYEKVVLYQGAKHFGYQTYTINGKKDRYQKSYTIERFSKMIIASRLLLFGGRFADWMEDCYKEYQEQMKKERKMKMSVKRLYRLRKIREYVEPRDRIKTSDVCQALGMNERMVQRYMVDLNTCDNNVGYDYTKCEYYIIK